MNSLTKFEMEETACLHLRDSTDELMYADGDDGKPDLLKPIRVYVYGPGSKRYAKALTTQQNRLMKRLVRKGKTDITPEEKLEDDVALVVECTKSFENVESEGLEGKAFFESIYSNQKLSFIREQVVKFTNDTANFSKPSTTNSASTSDK